MNQGRALELLGHAIEYLVDSQLHRGATQADGRAERILMRLSLEVFAECREVLPSRGWKRWLPRHRAAC
jgi:hypothetical protein